VWVVGVGVHTKVIEYYVQKWFSLGEVLKLTNQRADNLRNYCYDWLV